MQPAADHATVALLAFAQDAMQWGVEASRVTRIVRAADWTDGAPLDLVQRLQGSSSAAGRERVLVVATDLGEIPVWAGSEIHLRSCPAPDILALPAEVFASEAARAALTAVVLSGDHRPLFVVDHLGLVALARSESSPATSSQEH